MSAVTGHLPAERPDDPPVEHQDELKRRRAGWRWAAVGGGGAVVGAVVVAAVLLGLGVTNDDDRSAADPVEAGETVPIGDHYLRAAERLAAQHAQTTEAEAERLLRANLDATQAALDGTLAPADLRTMADQWGYNAYWLGDAGCVAARTAALRITAAALATADAMAAGNTALANELAARFDREALDALALVTDCPAWNATNP